MQAEGASPFFMPPYSSTKLLLGRTRWRLLDLDQASIARATKNVTIADCKARVQRVTWHLNCSSVLRCSTGAEATVFVDGHVETSLTGTTGFFTTCRIS